MGTRILRAPLRATAALAMLGGLVWPTHALAETISWVDWTAGTAGAAGTATGTVTFGGQTSTVSYSGEIEFIQTAGGTNYWNASAPYISATVDNAPPASDIIALSRTTTKTLTFNPPLRNPIMAVVSLNGNAYVFDADFQILSSGAGHWGTGTFSRTNPAPGVFNLNGLTGEPHGAVEFQGVLSTLTWTSNIGENWNGFTIGARGFACTSHKDTPTALAGTDCPYTSTPVCSVAGTCVGPVANGTAIPANPSGAAPYDGTCRAADAAILCASAVCSIDNKCGFANGDGPCNAGNAATVCRSGTCSTNGLVCMPAGGCAVDADCGATEFCSTDTYACVPKLSNDTAIPTIPNHTPALAGTCSVAVGTSVCTAAVCDTTDNKCGYANGNGACSAGNAATVCRSSACDAGDTKCGIANGGACTAAAQCRSATCTNNVCVPPSGCTIDSDCTATQFCNTQTLLCTPKLSNGTDIPTITGHTPALTGTCNAAVGTSVCAAGVCDGDNKCGFANGNGTCTNGTAATVCRSGSCDPNDMKCGIANGGTCNGGGQCRSTTCASTVCIPSGGCAVDADCSTNQFCNTQTSACVAKLSNGTAVPSITGHTPPLTGTCNAAVGTAVCSAAVCDTSDNACGFANGNGTCTSGNAATVCRSAACDATDSKCGVANGGPCTAGAQCRSNNCNGTVCVAAGGCAVDADCSSTQFCNTQTSACTGKLENGTAIPSISGHTPPLDGTCNAAVGTAVCVSAACSTADGKCGLNLGETCGSSTACRVGSCIGGTCQTVTPGSDAGTGGVVTPDGGVVDDGVVEGGGVGCSMSTSGGGSSLALLGFGLALAGLVRRRRDRNG